MCGATLENLKEGLYPLVSEVQECWARPEPQQQAASLHDYGRSQIKQVKVLYRTYGTGAATTDATLKSRAAMRNLATKEIILACRMIYRSVLPKKVR